MKWQNIKYVLMVIAAWLFVIVFFHMVYFKVKYLFNI